MGYFHIIQYVEAELTKNTICIILLIFLQPVAKDSLFLTKSPNRLMKRRIRNETGMV
ncbi:MAG: hypothetical protein ACFWTJ_12735 [Lachnoclostridium sp.]|jgi:hypothetical protein